MKPLTRAFLSGVFGTCGVLEIAGYLFMGKKMLKGYSIDKENRELMETRRHVYREIDLAQKHYDEMRKEHDEKIEAMEKEASFYEDAVYDAKANYEHAENVIDANDHKSAIQYLHRNPLPVYSRDPSESQEDEDEEEEPEDGYENPDDELREKLGISQRFDKDGHFIIVDRNDRMSGPLNDKEQEDYDSLGGDPKLEYSFIEEVKERRFDESKDPDELTYMITEDDWNHEPAFFDNDQLDYYEEDDILARDGAIVQDVEDLINPICLNNFFAKSNPHHGTVYCRNDGYHMDYEITWHEGSYQNEVLGIPQNRVYHGAHKFNKERADELEEQYENK